MDETNRTVPHSTDAEKSVLGSILLSSLAAEKALEVLNAEDFFSVAHRDIFSAMQALYNSGKLIDNVTLVDMLERQGKLDSAGGMGYIAELAIYTPSAANIEHYISIVEGHSMRRRLISVGSGHCAGRSGQREGNRCNSGRCRTPNLRHCNAKNGGHDGADKLRLFPRIHPNRGIHAEPRPTHRHCHGAY